MSSMLAAVRSSRQCCRNMASRMASARSMATASADFATASAGSVKIAARPDSAPTAAISAIVRAGSRAQPTPGVAHLLERFAFKSTSKRSTLLISRENELLGGALTTSLTREHLILTAQCLPSDSAFYVQLLAEVLSSSRFKDFELAEEVLPSAKLDYEEAMSNPFMIGSEAVHRLAFRRGLGNPLLFSPERVPSVEAIAEFAHAKYVAENVALVASGVSLADLESMAGKYFTLPSGQATPVTKSAYYGGEVRITSASPISYYFIGLDSSALSPAEQSVLQHALGGTTSVKWSPGASPLSGLAEKHAGARIFATNSEYSDAGLLQLVVAAPESIINATVKDTWALVKSLAEGSALKAEDVKRGAAQAKFSLLSASEVKTTAIGNVGESLLAQGKVADTAASLAAIDAVDVKTLKAALAKVVQSKPSVAAIGNTDTLPYADEL